MAQICVCSYPLMIIDTRNGHDIEYLAMPVEIIKDGGISVPEIDYIETEGLDDLVRGYIAVLWQDPGHDNFKKYDVAGHIVIAGCDLSKASKKDTPEGSLYCENKDIYLVLHPVEEWIDRHIIELPPKSKP